MSDLSNKETRSYKDPMAARIDAAERRREALEEEFPRVSDVYDGFFVRLEDLSLEESRFFLGAEAIIGTALILDSENTRLLSNGGLLAAQLGEATAKRLAGHAAKGWSIQVLIVTTYYRAQDKGAVVDLAFLCWDPQDAELDAALTAFAKGIAERFAAGRRAEIALTQKQFIQVLQSKGAWYLTQTIKREPLEKGTVVFKSRRSGTERLTAYALRHRSGCNILSLLFLIALAAGIVFLIWYFFFR
ncbi:MAG: hypothetical protein FWE41_05980 [Coriobacteriia bacterium]|nr:hypothetical protein [Coriobacteriia bacterium]